MTELLTRPVGSRAGRLAAPAAVTGTLALAVTALHVRDPHVSGSWGFCPSAALGFWCPGCGGLRAVNDLTHLDVAAAASSNLAFVVALPFLLTALLVWTLDRWRGTRRRFDVVLARRLAVGGVTLLAVFTVLRNLPAGTWLAP